MRRPGLWSLIGLLIAAAGATALMVSVRRSFRLPIWDESLRTFHGINAIAGGVILAGLVMATLCWLTWRKRNQLRDGMDVIVRWRVGMLDWAAFRRRDAARDGLFPSLRNRLRLPAEIPPEGIDIRAGGDAILIGDACYGIGIGFMPSGAGALVDVGWVEGAPGMLEFITYRQSRNSSKLKVARLPVPDGARAAAQTLIDHFQATLDARRREKIREHFALHFQAAEGDAGEAEAARIKDRSRNWLAAGVGLLVVGVLLLLVLATRAPGSPADGSYLRFIAIAAPTLTVAGLACLVISILSRWRLP